MFGAIVGMWMWPGTCPHQVLAATLTLFQPREGVDYAHHIMMTPPRFESHMSFGQKIILG